jgi:glycosyltransferase involved in cell wall biosynthesis
MTHTTRRPNRTPERVALFLPSLEGGGAERSAATIASELHERGHRVDVVLARAVGPFLRHLSARVRVIDLGAPRVVASAPALTRYLRRTRPETLLCSISNANVTGVAVAATMRRAPRTVIVEHTMLSQIARWTRKARHRLVVPAARWAYPRADAVIAVSRGVADDIAGSTSLSAEGISVIPNPVLTPALSDQAAEPLEDPWFGPRQEPVILAIGSLTGPKDFATLIRAFAMLRGRGRRARLLILGEGDRRRSLERMAARLRVENHVRFPGFANNPYPHLAAAAVLALSSRCEGLPTVLIEALALGTPVVATACPSGPREILEDGCLGELVPPHSPSAMADALARALNDGHLRKVPAASLSRYGADHVVDQYERVLFGAASPLRSGVPGRDGATA